MKDQRVAAFRKLLNSLVESLDATARITRWRASESVPEPLKESASKLVERLGSANRLASDRYTGPPPVVACLDAMIGATKRLDAAYAEFLRVGDEGSAQRQEAALVLDDEISGVKAESHSWS
jgi:hypothetical protein